MKANEIFSRMKKETVRSVFQYLRDSERDAYTTCLGSLAATRKLRPVYVQKKPVTEQIDWLTRNIGLRTSGEVAENVLQIWLLKVHPELLTEFLDGLGIEHDGKGSADEIPEKINAKKLKKTVDSLLEKHDSELVAVYLHTFQTQRAGGWEEITKLIESNPDLSLSEEEEK